MNEVPSHQKPSEEPRPVLDDPVAKHDVAAPTASEHPRTRTGMEMLEYELLLLLGRPAVV